MTRLKKSNQLKTLSYEDRKYEELINLKASFVPDFDIACQYRMVLKMQEKFGAVIKVNFMEFTNFLRL